MRKALVASIVVFTAAVTQNTGVAQGKPTELFRALTDRRKTTELVFSPREGHGFSEYYHQQDRMTRIYDWVTRYTLGSDSQ